MAIQYDWLQAETPLLVTESFNEALFRSGLFDVVFEVGTMLIVDIVVPVSSFDDVPLVVIRTNPIRHTGDNIFRGQLFAVPVAVAALCAPGWKQ